MTEKGYQCTYTKDEPEIKTQHLFACKTCKFSMFDTICEGCAKYCHSGHEIVDKGYIKGYCRCGRGCSMCHCFLKNPVVGMEQIPETDNRQCTYILHGRNYINMWMAQCATCGMNSSTVVCDPCMYMCHHDHSVVNRRYGTAFCDCGDDRNALYHPTCKINQSLPDNPPIPICSSFFNTLVNQQGYSCKTCDPEGSHIICAFCKDECHANHNIENLGQKQFICSCGTREMKCKCEILAKVEPAA